MESKSNIGRKVGRYEILEEIGYGGMAVVYRAMDTVLEREVALKLLHPHLSSHIESRQRFLREAKAVARLKHPSVLEIYDYSEEDGEDIFIAMELVRGMSLRQFMDERRGEHLFSEAVALIMREVGTALAHAHEKGIVHRDVKPENILIGPGGQVKLSDFGIAHLVGTSQMTMTGQILGSPAYMSPEHVERVDLDERADIFSTGTVIYELAVGKKPFDGANPHAVIKKIVEGDYDDPLQVNPAAGHQLTQILRRCLAPSPDKRYATAEGMVADLDDTLVAVGVEANRGELKKFFEDTESWTDSLRPRAIAKTLTMGLGAKKAKRHSEAMDHFNRVLALEPGNERALSAVEGMSRRRKFRRVVEKALLVAPILIALGAVLWTFVLKDAPPEKRSRVAARKGGVATVTDDGPIEVIVANGKDKKSRKKRSVRAVPKKNPSRAVPKAAKMRDVIFTPKPMAVEIDIDGQERFAYGPKNRKRKLTVGKHTISFFPNDGKHFAKGTWNVLIQPGKGAFHFRETLKWRAATLIVEGNIPASVTVPGRATGKTNKPFRVELAKGPTEEITVLVTSEGYKPRTKQVTIQAGEKARVKIQLSKSSS